ncbi:hypothetical protein CL620_06300 [archaeon]|nr:hypothetical protein [archaeon]
MSDWGDPLISDSTKNGWDEELAVLFEDEADREAFLESGMRILDAAKDFLFTKCENENGDMESEFEAMCFAMREDWFPLYMVYFLATFLKQHAEDIAPVCTTMDDAFERGCDRHIEYLTDCKTLPEEEEIRNAVEIGLPPVGTDEYYASVKENLSKLQHEIDAFKKMYMNQEGGPSEEVVNHIREMLDRIDYLEVLCETVQEDGD